jgi:hypothetical protein
LNSHRDSELKVAIFQPHDKKRAKTTQQKHKLKQPAAKAVNPTPNQGFRNAQPNQKPT